MQTNFTTETQRTSMGIKSRVVVTSDRSDEGLAPLRVAGAWHKDMAATYADLAYASERDLDLAWGN